LIEQAVQQAQFVLVFVALGVIEQGAGSQAKHAHHLHERKTTSRFLFP